MRGLFYLLLLSNLVYFTVLYINGTEDTELDPYRGIRFEKKNLTLLSELPVGERPPLREGVKPEPGLAPWAEEIAEDRPDSSAGRSSPQCMRVSKISSKTKLQELQIALQKLGVGQFANGADSPAGGALRYWVMLPPYPNQNKATEAAAALKAMGIRDFFVIRNGEYGNAVSLGVFSTRERAKRRQAQIGRLKGRKWKVKIEKIGGPSSTENLWLSFRLSNKTEQVREVLRKQGLSSVKEISCK